MKDAEALDIALSYFNRFQDPQPPKVVDQVGSGKSAMSADEGETESGRRTTRAWRALRQAVTHRLVVVVPTPRPWQYFSGEGKKLVESRGGGRVNGIPKSLWEHAIKTFGSASLAMEWFGAECGALNNRSPIDVIPGEDGRREVDRILGCIDYGMIA